MTGFQKFLLGVIVTLTFFWSAISGIYNFRLISWFDMYALAILPILSGVLSAVIIFLFRGAVMTLDTLIDRISTEPVKTCLIEISKKGKFFRLMCAVPICLLRKINAERLKSLLTKLFRKGRFLALVGSAFFFCPFIIPIVAKACIKKEKNVYLATIPLNVIMTLIWTAMYFAGWEAIKNIFN